MNSLHLNSYIDLESRYNYTTLALSPDGVSLVAAEEDGEIHLISMISRTILHRSDIISTSNHNEEIFHGGGRGL